jgi:hypothetical protein
MTEPTHSTTHDADDRIVAILRRARSRLIASAGHCAADSPELLAAAVRLELGATELTLAERHALDKLLAAASADRSRG